jgi:predicted HicB family RNase H-like nuclease
MLVDHEMPKQGKRALHAPSHGGARAGAGRPPKPAGEARTAKVMVRFTESDHARLCAAAEREGLTLAELVAARALAASDD